jgi:cysteine desulfurase
MSVYLDHAASTPVRAEVVSLISHSLTAIGNPPSVHSSGQSAKQLLEESREKVAKALNCDRNEVIFTSGGTESNNLAIKGIFEARNSVAERPVIIAVDTEHHAVLEPIERLVATRKAEYVAIPVHRSGDLELGFLEGYLAENSSRVALISVMWANNETGLVVDIPAVTKLAARYEIPVHTDAVAAVGHFPVDFAASGAATLAFTGHKLGAPTGIGGLLVARNAKLTGQLHGGSQERNLRAGTQDAVGASALALAVSLAVTEEPEEATRLRELRGLLVAGVRSAIADAVEVSAGANVLPHIVDFVFPGCAGDSLLFLLDAAGVAVSNGSACSAGVTSASHVLLAMGFSQQDSSSCVRISLGHSSSKSDIEAFLAKLPEAHARAKKAGFTV